MLIDTKKLYKIGPYSHTITLPVDWVRSHTDINNVNIVYELGDLLIVIPETFSNKKMRGVLKQFEDLSLKQLMEKMSTKKGD